MFKRLVAVVLIYTVHLAVPSAAQASLIVGNLTANRDTVLAWLDEETYVAAPFTLDASFTPVGLQSATLRLFSNYDVIAAVSLWSDSESVPGSQLADLGSLTFESPSVLDYTFTPSAPFTLQGSSTYWIVVHMIAPAGPPHSMGWGVTFAYNSLDPGSDPAASIPNELACTCGDGGEWLPSSPGYQVQFAVHAVPEPAFATLLALVALVLRPRKAT